MLRLPCAALAATLAAGPAFAACTRGANVSWYGEPQRLRGGGTFHPDDSTCAHPTLPDGAVVRVKILPHGHAVDCVVNDRGPNPSTGCKLDVSRHVARLLGLLDRGVGRFGIEVVRAGP